jgi:N4-gp56 family major capsid protein
MYADGGTDYSTFDAVTTDATLLAASSILDAVTKLKVNRAQPAKGGMYVAATSPQVLSDVMKVDEWLNAAQYSNVQELYKGEVGSLYGAKFIMHTNGWSSIYSSSDDDRFAYSVAGSGTTAAGANIRATLFLGEQAFGVPELASQSPFSPKVIITDTADKTDPLNQLTTAGFKVFWTTLRLNPNYYVIMRSKTASTA